MLPIRWMTSLTRFRKDDIIRNQDSICGILPGLAPRCHHHRRSFSQSRTWRRMETEARTPARVLLDPLMQSKASLWSAIKSFHNPSRGLSTPRVPNPELSTNPPRASNFHDTISSLFPSSCSALLASHGVIFRQLKLQGWYSLKSCARSGAVDYFCDLWRCPNKLSWASLAINKYI